MQPSQEQKLNSDAGLIARDGVFFQEFVAPQGPMGLICQKGGDLFSLRARFETTALVFPMAHSRIRLSVLGEENRTMDTCSMAILTKESEFTVTAISSIAELAIFLPTPELIGAASQRYGLPEELLTKILGDFRLLPRTNWINEIMYRYVFERVVAKTKSNTATDFLESEILKEIFYLYKYRNVSVKNRFNVAPLDLAHNNQVLKSALVHIESHLFEPVTMEDLCRVTNSSESTVLRTFRRELGKTPFEYIKDRKLDEALVFLKSRNQTVSEIADIIGYQNTSAFISAFKKKFGYTPKKHESQA